MRPRRVDLALLAVAAVWGSSYLATKSLVTTTGVVPGLALRYVVAAAVLAGVCAFRPPPRASAAKLRVGVVTGLTQATVLALETFGVARTSATNAGVVISLTIVLTPLLEGVASRQWLPPPFFVAAVAAVVGVGLLVTDGGLRAPSVGDALVLAAAVVRAGHVVLSSRLTSGRPYSTRTLALTQLTVGATVFSALNPVGLALAARSLDVGGWADALYLAVGCSVFAFLAQLWAVRRSSAARVSLLLGTEPVWAVLVGVVVGGDVLGLRGTLGAVVVVAATTWGQRVEAKARHACRAGGRPDQLRSASYGDRQCVSLVVGEEPAAYEESHPLGRFDREA